MANRLYFKYMHLRSIRKAQAALSTIFLIGGVILLFAVTLAVIAISFANSSIGFQASNRAHAIAMGGIRIAELYLLVDKDSASTGYCVPIASLPCPSGSAKVTVTQNSPTAGKVTILSDATVNRRRRLIQAVYVKSTTTEIIPISLKTINQ
jgi:hypothetical protein